VIAPPLAESLAALAAAMGVAGVAFARPRRPTRTARRRSPPDPRYLWLGVPAGIALVLPGPRLVTLPLAVFLGDRGRRLVASRAAVHRLRAMDAELPQLLDLLAAASAAGLSAVAGLRAAVSVLRGPLGDELRSSLVAIDLGSRWREELAAVTERLALPDLRRAVAVLTRTETLGTSLADATRELAADVRDARSASLAERARTAPVKMLFPLVFLVLPAFLLLTVVPVLLTTMRSIR
jgi:pilus assembly protein TadC